MRVKRASVLYEVPVLVLVHVDHFVGAYYYTCVSRIRSAQRPASGKPQSSGYKTQIQALESWGKVQSAPKSNLEVWFQRTACHSCLSLCVRSEVGVTIQSAV